MITLYPFLTAASCPKKDFYNPTPHPPKTCNRLLYCKIEPLLYCVLKKACQKAGPKRQKKGGKTGGGKKAAKKAAKKFIPEPVLLKS